MHLPSGKKVRSNTPIYPGSNFTWGEATKGCKRYPKDLIINGNLVISNSDVEVKIVETAKKLDEVRHQLGSRPLFVNSWYRPSHINARVGGSKWSRHQFGDAVDIRSGYLSPHQIYDLLKEHYGGLGRYYGFVHIDWRGYKARW